MKNFLILFLLILSANSVFATECSEFVSKQQTEVLSARTHITVKKEHIEEYEQCIGGQFIPAIAYGYGDMKTKGIRKKRISYICLLNKELKPIWCCVIPR